MAKTIEAPVTEENGKRQLEPDEIPAGPIPERLEALVNQQARLMQDIERRISNAEINRVSLKQRGEEIEGFGDEYDALIRRGEAVPRKRSVDGC